MTEPAQAPILAPVEPWPYDQPTRFDTVLDRLTALRECIAAMSGDCPGGGQHIWVMVTNRDNRPRTVCAKCGAAG